MIPGAPATAAGTRWRLGGALLVLAVAMASAQCRAPAAAPRSHVSTPPPPDGRAFVPLTRADGRPLSPLALAGRDVFLREGCQVCHGVVPPGAEQAARWPDEELVAVPGPQRASALGQEGGKYPDLWHYKHLESPTVVSPGSIMPPYPFLLRQRIGPALRARVAALVARIGGADRPDAAALEARLSEEGAAIARGIAEAGSKAAPDSEAVAVIAYLQQLDHPRADPAAPAPAPPLSEAERAALDQRLTAAAPATAARGEALFGRHCAACHGPRGQGLAGVAQPLTDGQWRHGGRPSAVLRTIEEGLPTTAMVSWRALLAPADREALAAWVAVTLQGAPAPGAPAPVPQPEH